MRKILSAILVFVVLVAIVGGFIVYKSLFSLNDYSNGKPKILFVSKGMNFDDVKRLLIEKEIVNGKLYFEIALNLIGGENNIRVGKYSIPSGLTNHDLLNMLRSGGAIVPVTVAFSEGTRIKTMAKILRRDVGIDSARYVSLAFDESFVRKYGIHSTSFEGYLYPSTYQLMWQSDEEEILEKQLEAMENIFTSEWKQRAKQLNLSMHDVLTLASIVEGETHIDSERSMVACVYLNRLKKGMPLQADPTIQYALPDGPRRLHNSDYKIESPFNTYRYYGLPPGPINNPGKESILAVLFPKNNNNMYFVANGLGGHTFTTNYNDHLSAVKKLQRFLKERDEEKEKLKLQSDIH